MISLLNEKKIFSKSAQPVCHCLRVDRCHTLNILRKVVDSLSQLVFHYHCKLLLLYHKISIPWPSVTRPFGSMFLLQILFAMKYSSITTKGEHLKHLIQKHCGFSILSNLIIIVSALLSTFSKANSFVSRCT